jgi:2-iminobutanoate/2-iminopropanoate deaminase
VTPSTIHRVESANSHQHTGGFPQAVVANGFVFMSAIRGTNPAGDVVLDDPESQAEQALRNAVSLLEAIGGAADHLVRIVVYMVDLHDRAAFNRAWKRVFPTDAPARLAVQVADVGAPGDASRFLLEVTALDPSVAGQLRSATKS